MSKKKFIYLGQALRSQAKSIVIDYMESNLSCGANGEGVSQTEIFRECGLDWGDKEKAPSTSQQFWVVALLKELSDEQVIEQVRESGPWRLKQ